MAPATRSPLLGTAAGRRLLGAQCADVLALGVGTVAVPWLVLDGGADASTAGLAFATGSLPYVIFGIPAGLAGDRVPPARILAVGHALQAALALLIPAWAWAGGAAPVAVVLAVALAVGSIRAFTDAAAFGAIAGIAGPERFMEAQAALTAAWSAGFLVGPALGGLAIHALGAADAMAVMAGAFAVGALLGSRLPRPRLSAREERSAGASLRAGMRVIVRDPAVRVLTLAMASWNIVGTGVYALAVPLLRDDLGLSAREVGLVFGVGAAMGLVSAPLVGAIERRADVGTVLFALVATHGVAALGLALSGSLTPAVATYGALELAGWMTVTLFIGARQRRAPADLQALVGMSGRVIGQGTMTLGTLLASAAAGLVGVHDVYVAMAVGTVVVALAWSRALVRTGRVVAA